MWFLVGTLSGWFVKQVFDFYLMEVEALLEAPLMLHSCLVEWKYCFFFLHVCVCSNAHTIIFYASVTVREFWIFPPDSVVNTHRHTHRICHMCADVSSFPLTVAISVLPYHSLSFLLFFFFSPVFLYLCFFLFFSQQHFLFSPLSLWIVPMSFINSSPTEGREGGSPVLRYTVEWAACYTTRSVSVRQLHKDGKCYGHRRGALVTFMFCIFTAIRE